jgi:sigma-B regulation protein RsbU (phosphoserine phosphatase)
VNRPVASAPSASSTIGVPAEKSIYDSKILIADDEPLCCRLLAGILRRKQFTNFQFAEGGYSALEQIESFKPDLVLLDMQMPDLPGLDVCRRIRANPDLVDLPILVQTATIDRKEMGILFEAGASDFLSKPINPSELVSRVTVHLERRSLLRELRDYRERTSMELDAARRMQFDLLPAQPIQQELAAAAGLRIGSYCRSSSEIGGDLWGILPINTSSFGLFLADFAGHGVTAALNTFRLHALIHEHTALHHDPAGLLAMLNERLKAVLSPGQFATFLYVVVDASADRLRFASAGAPPLIVTQGLDGSAVLAEASGLPLGVVRGAEYQLHQRPFGPDSMLLLFSDGLSEFPDARGMRIGDEGLRKVVGSCHSDLTPDQVIDRLCEAAGVGEGSTLPDDTTVVCVDRRMGSPSRACLEVPIVPGLSLSLTPSNPAVAREVCQPCGEI